MVGLGLDSWVAPGLRGHVLPGHPARLHMRGPGCLPRAVLGHGVAVVPGRPVAPLPGPLPGPLVLFSSFVGSIALGKD